MAHRGRLNVLANIIGKSPQEIFREFEDAEADLHHGRGDVKYHLGYHNDWTTLSGRKIHLTLCANPSHLEFVNPVALGLVRAKQYRDAFQAEYGTKLGFMSFFVKAVIEGLKRFPELNAEVRGWDIAYRYYYDIGIAVGGARGSSSPSSATPSG
jgi:hypothetical protein